MIFRNVSFKSSEIPVNYEIYYQGGHFLENKNTKKKFKGIEVLSKAAIV